MKRIFEGILSFAAFEAVHFIILTGVLCGFGFFTRADGETGVTFKQLLWNGAVKFWFDGVGPVVLLCLFGAIIWEVGGFIVDLKGLEEKRKNLDKEALQAGQRLAAMMRTELEATIKRDYERKYADRNTALAEGEESLAWRYKDRPKNKERWKPVGLNSATKREKSRSGRSN